MSEPNKEYTSVHIDGQPVEITLSKGQRGSYGWDIKVKAKDYDTAIKLILEADAVLKNRFATEFVKEGKLE